MREARRAIDTASLGGDLKVVGSAFEPHAPARDSEFARLARLDAGARSRRAAGLEDSSIIEFGPFSIDERERLLRRHGQPVPLTPKAVDVLLALVERPGRLLTKDELVQRVWPDTFVEEANLAYNVFTLRKALGDTADNPEYVETIAKRGYRFKAPVRRSNGDRDSSDGETAAFGQGSRAPAILAFPEQPTHRFDGTAVLEPVPHQPPVVTISTGAHGEGRLST